MTPQHARDIALIQNILKLLYNIMTPVNGLGGFVRTFAQALQIRAIIRQK
jgi:hypothetical protein